MSNVAAFELAEAPKEIEINPVTIHIGAEIDGWFKNDDPFTKPSPDD